MDSPSKNRDTIMSTDAAMSVAIDYLSLLTVSSNEPSCPPRICETQIAEQVLHSQFDINCNEMCTNHSSLITRNDKTTLLDAQSDNRECVLTISEDLNPAKDGGEPCVISSAVPWRMRQALRDSIYEKVKIDYVVRQNDHSNSQYNSVETLHSSPHCIVTLYDSETEDSECSLDSNDYSTDESTESEYLGRFHAQNLSSSRESLHSDGESVESSNDLGDSGEDSSDSDECSGDEPSENEQTSDNNPEHSGVDTDGTSDDEIPEPADDEKSDPSGDDDEDTSDDDISSVSDEEATDPDDDEESSDDDKSIDLEDNSELSSDSSGGWNESDLKWLVRQKGTFSDDSD